MSSTVDGMYKWNGSFATTDISDYQNNPSTINVFPNPFTSQVTILINSELVNSSDLWVEVIDVYGKVIFKGYDFKESKKVINLENLASGIYFYKIYNTDKMIGCGRLITN